MTNHLDLSAGPAGARDLILECQQLLAGERSRLTPLKDYTAERLSYWQSRAESTPEPAADRAA